MYLEPAITEVTLAAKGVDGSRVVVSDLLLLRVVAHTHTDVIVTCPTERSLADVIEPAR